MAAFTTTSPASGYIINSLMVVAVIAIAGLVGSYVTEDRAAPDPLADVAHLPLDAATPNINPATSY